MTSVHPLQRSAPGKPVPADRRAGPVLRAIGLVAAVAALALLPIDPIAAQQRDAVAIEGVVIDATTRNPVGGARIVVSRNRGVTTDSVGVFRLTGLDEGDHLVLVESFGYESVHVTATAGVGLPRIEIPLSPAPMVLAGLSVEVVARNVATMDERIRLRRDAAAVSVRAIDQDRLLRSGARNMLELLQFEASLHPEPCSGGRVSSGWCVTRRGSMVKPTVFIDEAPAIGGLDELATYRPHEVYLVEVWSGGSTIRAYTNQFMERMGRRPVQLIYGW